MMVIKLWFVKISDWWLVNGLWRLVMINIQQPWLLVMVISDGDLLTNHG